MVQDVTSWTTKKAQEGPTLEMDTYVKVLRVYVGTAFLTVDGFFRFLIGLFLSQ